METLTTIKVYKKDNEIYSKMKQIIREEYDIKMTNEDIQKYMFRGNEEYIQNNVRIIMENYTKEVEEQLNKMREKLLKKNTRSTPRTTTKRTPKTTK